MRKHFILAGGEPRELKVSILYWRCRTYLQLLQTAYSVLVGFNSLLEMHGGFADLPRRQREDVSILYWRCPFEYPVPAAYTPRSCFNSLLEMPEWADGAVVVAKSVWFQFSIGDAVACASPECSAVDEASFNSLLEMRTPWPRST